jgi:phage I-like protein
LNKLYTINAGKTPITRLSESGTLFRKQLLRFGDWIDPLFPEEVMRHDRAFMESLVNNFNNKVVGRVPVPLTHTDNPEYNTGELVGLSIEGDGSSLEDGLYGILDIRRTDTAKDIADGLLWDVSISFSTHYTDNQTGEDYGPTLYHVALVNNPYIKKMKPFAALSEMLKKQFGDVEVYALSEQFNKENDMKLTKVSNTREFAIEVKYSDADKEVTATIEPGQEIEVAEDQAAAIETQLSEAKAPEAPKKKKEKKTELSDADKMKRELADARKELRTRDVEALYQTALSEGKVVPAQENVFKALANSLYGRTRNLSDGKTQNLSDLFTKFLAKAPKVVSFDESGKNTNDDDTDPVAKLSEEIKQGLAKTGTSPEDYVKYGSGESISISEIANKKEEN